MFNGHISRPVLMIVGHKSKLWIGVLGGLLILVVIGWGRLSTSVKASAEGETIQIQVENPKQTDSGENYFVNYRLKREQDVQEAKDMLADLLNSTVPKSKEQAQEKWLELSTKMQKEGDIENILKIRGFQDALADVFPENVTVIVYAPNLTPNDVSLIQDIVMRVTNVRLDKIAISAKK